jgi:divinyl protochlorophyllide a 8-vinyl-reductase
MTALANAPAAMAAAHAAGLIGPNAITRVAEVLPTRIGSRATWDLFDRAGLVGHLRQPPADMVDETEVRRLHGQLRSELGPEQAAEVARAAGRRTADYLLAHRIPKLAQRLMRALPARLAARVLLHAIARNAWTFVGSGGFEAVSPGGRRWLLRIRDNPLCRDLHTEGPACDYYAATFERLFVVLVHRGSSVRETACEAAGDDRCEFELRA